MKKKIYILPIVISLIITNISATSLADVILFRGLQWGSNIKEYEKTYNVSDGMIVSRANEQLMNVKERLDNLDPKILNYSKNEGWVSILINLDTDNGLRLFDFPVTMVYAYFTYGIDDNQKVSKSDELCNIYMAEYIFDVQNGSLAYNDIKKEFDSIYGKGDEKIFYNTTLILHPGNEPEYVNAMIYKCFYYGENHTVCMIEKAMNEEECFSLSIVYAQTNDDDPV